MNTAWKRSPIRGASGLIAGIAVVILLAGPPPVSGAEPEGDRACDLVPQPSRWSPSATGQGYTRTAKFGQGEGSWISALTGVAVSPEGDVFVYDGHMAMVHRLDARLGRQGFFGRQGEGPGEFRIPMVAEIGDYWIRNFAVADDSLVYVFDGRTLTGFEGDGALARELGRLAEGFMIELSVKHAHPVPGGILFSRDVVDTVDPSIRALETWLINDEGRELQYSFPLPPLPQEEGRSGRFVGPQEARPFWAVHGSCLIIGDGGSQHMVRVNLETGVADTITLPNHEVRLLPESLRLSGAFEQMRRSMEGGHLLPDSSPPPAQIWRWAEVVADPDGHVWVNPWRPREERSHPLELLRISPDGTVHEEVLPAFPLAFGLPGTFYTRATDPDTDEILLVRYDLDRPRR